jgi:hypothetical protein
MTSANRMARPMMAFFSSALLDLGFLDDFRFFFAGFLLAMRTRLVSLASYGRKSTLLIGGQRP